MTEIIQKLTAKKAKIGIVGLGYVGLPLARRYSEVGYQVLGFEIDDEKVKKLLKNETYIKHIESGDIAKMQQNGFVPTTDFTRISEADAIILCVPTPLNKYREPDLSFVIDTTENILPYLRKEQVLSLESTTYPGTTDEELAPRVESKGFKIGTDFYLVYSPEREDPGNAKFNTQTIPKVVGGYSKKCLEVGSALYGGIIDKIVPVSSTRAAEMTKLLENIHRSVNIGLVNEMKIVSDKMGIDIHEVIDAAATKPFGFTAYYPGPGIGGHCIPIDPFYLTWKAREYGLHTRFIELAGEINSAMPKWVINKVIEGLNKHEKSLKGSKVLVLGISYKKNVDDARESPSVEIMGLLKERGADVQYSDPYWPAFPKKREHHFDLHSVELTAQNIKSFDCIILATSHDDFDYKAIADNAILLVDTRGMYHKEVRDNIVQA
jgi:UDP-N-acetyl-D-glucosamine dehydrogenase